MLVCNMNGAIVFQYFSVLVAGWFASIGLVIEVYWYNARVQNLSNEDLYWSKSTTVLPIKKSSTKSINHHECMNS